MVPGFMDPGYYERVKNEYYNLGNQFDSPQYDGIFDQKYPDEVLFIISNNLTSLGKDVLGKKIVGPLILEEYDCESVKVIIATFKHIEEIKNQAFMLITD